MKAIARFVAPTNPLGRFGSALAVTAVLTSVQVGLVAGHTGPDLCRLAGTCSPPEQIAGGKVLQGSTPGTQKPHAAAVRRSPASPGNSGVQSAAPVRTVAFLVPAHGGNGRFASAKAAKSDPGSSAVPEKRRRTHALVLKAHHATKHHHSRS
jgi:hypothetical protein